jgi:hypothetical protein
MTWEELRKHAEFPRAAVTTHDETVTVPADTLWRAQSVEPHGPPRYAMSSDANGPTSDEWIKVLAVKIAQLATLGVDNARVASAPHAALSSTTLGSPALRTPRSARQRSPHIPSPEPHVYTGALHPSSQPAWNEPAWHVGVYPLLRWLFPRQRQHHA